MFTCLEVQLLSCFILVNTVSCSAVVSANSTTTTTANGTSSSGQDSRPGVASTTHSCGQVRRVPEELRAADHMALDNFYQKYTEAYGIPVVSSEKVPDSALKRACYVLRFLAADHPGVREAVYRNYGRVGVTAETEYVTTIPEHSHLDPTYWNWRARGLGGNTDAPVSTAAEENLLCSASDTNYPNQDLLVHELSHGIHLLGVVDAIQHWDSRLNRLYLQRKVDKKWDQTYSMSTPLEYFAEGTQAYFNVNSYSAEPNGREGPVNTREKLKQYDPELYALIKQVFPCGNVILDRCNTTRQMELEQELNMDCELTDGEEGTIVPPLPPVCSDQNDYCSYWAKKGYCEESTHEEYMSANCMLSCSLCDQTLCVDLDGYCSAWAREGYCTDEKYTVYMSENCKESCSLCPGQSCPDMEYNCVYWASNGECEKSKAYMLENCKNSCGVC